PRADAGSLPCRALRAVASEYSADIAEARRLERRPAKQPRAENAERDRDRKLALQADKSGDRQRDDAADDLDGARERERIGRAKHLQHQIKNENGDSARNQSWHSSNIVALAAKIMAQKSWFKNRVRPDKAAGASRSETRSELFHLTEQLGRATFARRQPFQGLASTGGKGRRRSQQFTQLRRRAGIEPAPCAAGQARDLAEGLFGGRIMALLEQEHGHLEHAELSGLGAEVVDPFFHGVADEHHRAHASGDRLAARFGQDLADR